RTLQITQTMTALTHRSYLASLRRRLYLKTQTAQTILKLISIGYQPVATRPLLPISHDHFYRLCPICQAVPWAAYRQVVSSLSPNGRQPTRVACSLMALAPYLAPMPAPSAIVLKDAHPLMRQMAS